MADVYFNSHIFSTNDLEINHGVGSTDHSKISQSNGYAVTKTLNDVTPSHACKKNYPLAFKNTIQFLNSWQGYANCHRHDGLYSPSCGIPQSAFAQQNGLLTGILPCQKRLRKAFH